MLSVVITAWNEEKNLPRVVKSVTDLASEIIVVDTESTDKTALVARQLGCQVYHHPNTRIVEPVRNFSISKAKGDWILLLDADEEVSPALADQIRHIITAGKYDYIRLPRKNIIFGTWIKSSHWWPDYVYRLFKKGAVTWQEQIHSIPLTVGQGYDFPPQESASLIHYNYESISQYLDRLNRYTDVQAAALISSAYRFSWPDLLLKPANEFLNQYFARRGYQDHLHGLALALLQSVSELILYLKVWQLSGFKTAPISPGELISPLNHIHRDFVWWYCQVRAEGSASLAKFYWKLLRWLNRLQPHL